MNTDSTINDILNRLLPVSYDKIVPKSELKPVTYQITDDNSILKQVEAQQAKERAEQLEAELKVKYDAAKVEIQKLLKEKSVAVIFHIRPDGDAIGSALALYFGLNKIGIKADVFCADDIPFKFNFIPNITLVKRNLTGEYSALIALDCGEINRLGEFAETFLRHKNTYNIDHHLSNDKYGDINYVKSNPSNCENVYQILKELNVPIDKDIANLYLQRLRNLHQILQVKKL